MPLPPPDDTIAAIATAPGVGAVGIIRIAGPEAFDIAEHIFRPSRAIAVSQLPAGRVVHGIIADNNETVDEALLLTFRAPHSYTTQDVIELQSHGGSAVLRKVLELVLRHGARLAQPGEFTLRAYLNGRLDLIQAESVLNLVNAQSDSARRSALLGLSKALSEQLALIQQDITTVYGNIQAVFDYPEEGVPESDFQAPLQRALTRVRRLLATAKAGQIAQSGARLALIGRPNAGKSSLLNALLGYERSIVSEIPGTTRDYLEAPLTLDGIPITAIDTAGLRETSDQIEARGVAVAREIAQSADVTLFLIDQSAPLLDADLHLVYELDPERLLIIASKTDLPPAWHAEALRMTVYPVSIKTEAGLDALKTAIHQQLMGDAAGSELWLSSERHEQALRTVEESLLRALNAPDDLAALDLEAALRALAEITGQGDISEAALEHIFANFCVGK
jgi:tRNA modification GTPase